MEVAEQYELFELAEKDGCAANGDSRRVARVASSNVYRSRIGLLVGMTSHSNEQYGYLSVCLRLKGLVPPSSDPR